MGISQSKLRDLHDLSLSDFLYSVFNTSGPIKSIVTGAKKSIFHEIGIHSLTQNQFKSLEELQLVHLYDCLRWFVMWISQGWYEYCSLPYTMKAHLSTPDKEAMIVLPDRYTRSNGQLLKDVKALVSVINHYEATSTITSHAFKNPQLSIVDLLSRLGGCGDQEELLQLIPETILMENYVAFCVALKQLMDKLHTRLSAESLSAQPQRKSWEDFVDDLWKNNLTHFRSGTYSYAVVMTSDQKKRVYSLRNIDRSDEELLNDLMTAGVSESELLPDTDIEDSSPSSTEPSIASYSPCPPRVRQRRDLEESSISSSISTQRLENTCAVKLAEGLSCEQVCEFLREIGLEQYIGAVHSVIH